MSTAAGMDEFDAAQRHLEDMKPYWSGLVREAILDQLREHGTYCANDLNHLDIPERIRKTVVGAQSGGLARAGFMEHVDWTKATRTESHGRDIKVFAITDQGRRELGTGVDTGRQGIGPSVDPGAVPDARPAEGAGPSLPSPRHELAPDHDRSGASSPPTGQASPHAGVDVGSVPPSGASVDPGERSIAPAEARCQGSPRPEPDPDLCGRSAGSGSTTSGPPAEPEQLELLTGEPAGRPSHIDLDQRGKAA